MARSVVHSMTSSMEQTGAELRARSNPLCNAEDRLRELEAELGERRCLAEEIGAGLSWLERAGVAASILGGIEYRQCPRCMQEVQPDRFDDSVCYVCGQPESEGRAAELDDPEPAVLRERQRLQALEAEIRALDEETGHDHTVIEETRRTMARRIDQAEGALEDQSRQQLNPAVEKLEKASADRAEAVESVRQFDVQLSTWMERGRLLAPIRELEEQLEARRADLLAPRSTLPRLVDHVSENCPTCSTKSSRRSTCPGTSLAWTFILRRIFPL